MFPTDTPVPQGTGIVHIGLSNFHRAHQAVHTAAALASVEGPWGILGVAPRSASVADAMAAQANRYAVVEISPAGERVRVATCVPALCTSAAVTRLSSGSAGRSAALTR